MNNEIDTTPQEEITAQKLSSIFEEFYPQSTFTTFWFNLPTNKVLLLAVDKLYENVKNGIINSFISSFQNKNKDCFLNPEVVGHIVVDDILYITVKH